jgi:molybdenum cofactor cytidylyltransferase
MTLAILILAAGAASRMRGTDKLLEQIDGIAQIRRIALAALDTRCPTYVTLPPDRPARAGALDDLPVTRITIPDAAEGMGASLRRAAGLIPPGAVMILLADLVDITAADLHCILAAHAARPTAILRGASADGTPGHPTVIPADLREPLLRLQGDAGARGLIDSHRDRLHLVPLPGTHATTDLDTPEAWAAWRASRGA